MSKNEANVTYIVPVYNAGSSIERCIASLFAQTSDAWEALFIDDGSTDDSYERLRQYAAGHPDKIRVLVQENAGVAKTRMRGIREAATEYVAFIDQDDFIDPDYTETLLDTIIANGADIVISGHRRVDDVRTIYTTCYKDSSDLSKYLAELCWAKLFRRGFLLDNDVRFLTTKIGEDIVFSCSAYLKTNRIVFVDYVGYNWYMNPSSVSNTTQRGLQEDCDILEFAQAVDALYDGRDEKNDVFRYYLFSEVVVQLLRSGQKATPERFVEETERIYRWLDVHGYRLEIPWYDKRLSPAKPVRRIGISFFNRLRKLRLTKPFAHVFCRG